MDDAFHLQRFIGAQEAVFPKVLKELRQGHKTSHWMWFIFPQMKGLGSSSQATYYGITSLEEANDYRQHSVLGPRLIECTQLVNQVEDRSIEQIFGSIDALKFRSSMTLFAETDSATNVFDAALANPTFAVRACSEG